MPPHLGAIITPLRPGIEPPAKMANAGFGPLLKQLNKCLLGKRSPKRNLLGIKRPKSGRDTNLRTPPFKRVHSLSLRAPASSPGTAPPRPLQSRERLAASTLRSRLTRPENETTGRHHLCYRGLCTSMSGGRVPKNEQVFGTLFGGSHCCWSWRLQAGKYLARLGSQPGESRKETSWVVRSFPHSVRTSKSWVWV